MEENLWPKIDLKAEENALSVLRKQAELLTKITDEVLDGEVIITEAYDEKTGELVLVYQLYVVAPKLGNNRFKIIAVGQRKEPFPVDLQDKINNTPTVRAIDLPDFKTKIEAILKDKKVTDLIKNLFSQSKQI
jgi:hypothetical protein